MGKFLGTVGLPVISGDASSPANGDLWYNSSTGKFRKRENGITSDFVPVNSQIRTINFIIDGGGSAITTGSKGFIVSDFAGTINSWTALADQSGSIVVDVKKSTYSSFPTTSSIAASAKPTLSSAQKNQDTTLTGWTTAVAAGDVIEFNVSSATTVTRVTISLKITVT